jgi:A/G-specific adenine glycosylase
VEALRRAVLAWYDGAKRDLPWRKTRDPYRVWLSEVMLQQTRVETVVPYFERFLSRFPTVEALAEAPVGDVLALWSGLGYYRRARMLHEAARQIAGRPFPRTVDTLRAIKGIGPYTAGAVASIAYGEPAALVDGNVARVFARIFVVEDDVRAGRGLGKIWKIAEELAPGERPGDWNQALMELGATICVPREPRCLLCPARAHCGAYDQGKTAELPRLARKTRPVPVHRAALVAETPRGLVLARRRPEGLFGGMWEPPSLDAGGDLRERFSALLGVKLGELEPRGSITHVLSHRRMQVDVHAVRLRSFRDRAHASDEYDAMEAGDLDGRGATTLARKILARAGGSRSTLGKR